MLLPGHPSGLEGIGSRNLCQKVEDTCHPSCHARNQADGLLIAQRGQERESSVTQQAGLSLVNPSKFRAILCNLQLLPPTLLGVLYVHRTPQRAGIGPTLHP